MTDRVEAGVEGIAEIDVITRLGDQLGLPGWVMPLISWLLFGLIMHFLLGFLFRRLHRFSQASEQRWDDIAITALEAPLKWLLWLFVVFVAIDLYPGLQGLQQVVFPAYDTGLILLITWFLRRLISGVEDELLREERGRTASSDRAGIQSSAKLLRITLWVLAAIMILQSLGVSIAGLLAFGGIGGIAVGFAAKDLLANFFGGLSIYLDRPFAKGDWIRSPDQEIEGTVEEIGWRLTRIRTFDQRPLYVPNAVFLTISVENPSRMNNRRIKETIGIRYCDAALMEKVVSEVKQMLIEHPDIEHQRRVLLVNFLSFGPSSLDFFIYTFTKTTNWVRFHEIKQDVLLKILAIIHNNGADVAFPTQTLHLERELPEEPSP
ncbi:MAG: mechanosensitive ion channel family protein [Pseudomonadota bacterium]